MVVPAGPRTGPAARPEGDRTADCSRFLITSPDEIFMAPVKSEPTMKLTESERAEVSRRNGRCSRGPKTAAGNERAKRNALVHGMSAGDAHHARRGPGRDRRRCGPRGTTYYRPRSPGAAHLIDLCVRAKLINDRCFRAHDAAVADQMAAAGDAFDEARAAMVADQAALLADDPAASAALRQTGAGCRALIARWETYRRLLEVPGCWRPGACSRRSACWASPPSRRGAGA